MLVLLAKIIISMQFNKLYLKYVQQKVNKINYLNNDKTNEEITTICQKEGGVIKGQILILSILGIIVSVASIDIGFTIIYNILSNGSTPF